MQLYYTVWIIQGAGQIEPDFKGFMDSLPASEAVPVLVLAVCPAVACITHCSSWSCVLFMSSCAAILSTTCWQQAQTG